MAHLYLLFLIFSLMTAFVTAGIYVFLYQKYKLDIIRSYLFHHCATIIMVFFVALNFYLYLNMGIFDNYMKILFGYTSNILLFSSPVIYTTPIFTRALAGKENTTKIKIFFAAFSMSAAVNGILIFSQGYSMAFQSVKHVPVDKMWIFIFMLIGMLIVFSTIVYSYTVLFKNYRKIDDPVRKLAARYLIIFSIAQVFLVYFDFKTQNHQLYNQQYPVGIFLQPLNLTIFSFISIAVLLGARKIHIQKSQKIPQDFILKYKITDREIEIIEMILSGLSNKEIASKLFLSPSTVRNHISNIFDKTEIPTRGKLQHLIKNSN